MRRLRVLDTGLSPTRWNVAMSAALLASVDEGAPATLRFHRYPASCVIGRNQDVETELDLAGCRAAGIEIARRPTGGGAVVMGPGVLAFDLAMACSGGDAMALAGRAGEALLRALRAAGLAAVRATPGSIEVGALKVSGSAGRIGRRAALYQGTLILDLSGAAPLSLLRRRTEAGRPTPDPAHRVGELAGHAYAEEALRLERGFAEAFDLIPRRDVPSSDEFARASAMLASTFGRDDFVLTGDVDERQAA